MDSDVIEEELENGFTRKLVRRKNGQKKGDFDVYVFPPDGKKLRSRVELRAYLDKFEGPSVDPDAAFLKSPISRVALSELDQEEPNNKKSRAVSKAAKEKPEKSVTGSEIKDDVKLNEGMQPVVVIEPIPDGKEKSNDNEMPDVSEVAEEELLKPKSKVKPVKSKSKDEPVKPKSKDEPVKPKSKDKPVKPKSKDEPVKPKSKDEPVKPKSKDELNAKDGEEKPKSSEEAKEDIEPKSGEKAKVDSKPKSDENAKDGSKKTLGLRGYTIPKLTSGQKSKEYEKSEELSKAKDDSEVKNDGKAKEHTKHRDDKAKEHSKHEVGKAKGDSKKTSDEHKLDVVKNMHEKKVNGDPKQKSPGKSIQKDVKAKRGSKEKAHDGQNEETGQNSIDETEKELQGKVEEGPIPKEDPKNKDGINTKVDCQMKDDVKGAPIPVEEMASANLTFNGNEDAQDVQIKRKSNEETVAAKKQKLEADKDLRDDSADSDLNGANQSDETLPLLKTLLVNQAPISPFGLVYEGLGNEPCWKILMASYIMERSNAIQGRVIVFDFLKTFPTLHSINKKSLKNFFKDLHNIPCIDDAINEILTIAALIEGGAKSLENISHCSLYMKHVFHIFCEEDDGWKNVSPVTLDLIRYKAWREENSAKSK
ncbi:claspin-like isoform X2 [Neocloeon triangulifer]|nr:claspin-like isoform X2 [Neocloeon triangulifer]